MKSLVHPELPTASVGSSQATTAAVDNSAPLANRPESTYKLGKVVQTNGATSTIMNIEYSNDQENEIKKTLNRLESSLMEKGSRGYNDYKGLSILDASTKQVEKWTQVRNAAIAVMGIILGANRNWERVVQPNLEKIKSEYQNMTFDMLQNLIKTHNYVEFADVWGHKDAKKYETLSNLVSAILKLKKRIKN